MWKTYIYKYCKHNLKCGNIYKKELNFNRQKKNNMHFYTVIDPVTLHFIIQILKLVLSTKHFLFIQLPKLLPKFAGF